jgi:putative Mg2+ transporter-C (MgtC) family protein
VLIANEVFAGSAEARARMVEGVIAGMGFIGGGAVLKQQKKVAGVTTAVSLWNTGAIGVAAAFSMYEIAVLLSAVNLATLRLLMPLKKEIESSVSHSEDEKRD